MKKQRKLYGGGMARTAHPFAADLMDYAENLCSEHGTVSATTGSHVAGCERCRIEVDKICATLGVVRDAEDLYPSREFRAALLLAARSQTQARPGILPLAFGRPRFVRTLGMAACLLMAAGVTFWAVENKPELTLDENGMRQMNAALFTLESLRMSSPEEELLSKAVMSSSHGLVPAWERAQRRTIQTLEEDIEEALATLERNPACMRARELISVSRQRLKMALKKFYMERSL